MVIMRTSSVKLNNKIIRLAVDDIQSCETKIGAIETWDVSEVTDMSALFQQDALFNRNISAWYTSNVTDMSDMFHGASAFNQPDTFDTSNVTDMSDMSCEASAFNQSVYFNTSNVADMSYISCCRHVLHILLGLQAQFRSVGSFVYWLT